VVSGEASLIVDFSWIGESSICCTSAPIRYAGNVPLAIQLPPSEQQSAFHLQRWFELQNDPDLARLPHRIETDRHGHILMSSPPPPSHGSRQLAPIVLRSELYRRPALGMSLQ
jgi:hypothetical protein